MTSEPRGLEQDLVQEVVAAAEQAHVLAGHSVEALSRLIAAGRRFERARRAGGDPDPAALLLAFGGASTLLRHLSQRFEAGALALEELRFTLAPALQHAEEAEGPDGRPEIEPDPRVGAPRPS